MTFLLQAEIQQFYAGQMQRLDSVDAEGFAATFTEDGEFVHQRGKPPVRTRERIAAEVRAFHQRFAGDPVQRRHWFTGFDIRDHGATIDVTYYALILTTRPGGDPVAGPACVTTDTLVRSGDGLLVRSRRVLAD